MRTITISLILILKFGYTYAQQKAKATVASGVPLVYEIFTIPASKIKLNDTITLYVNGDVIKLFIYDREGRSYVERFRNNVLVEKGSYKGSDSLWHSVKMVKVLDSKEPGRVDEYFYRPVRSGEWTVLDSLTQNYIKKSY